MKHSMDYLSLIQSIPAHRTALIEDGRFYTYGTLVMEACRIRSLSPEPAAPSVAWIKAASVHGQLVRFLAFSGTSRHCARRHEICSRIPYNRGNSCRGLYGCAYLRFYGTAKTMVPDPG